MWWKLCLAIQTRRNEEVTVYWKSMSKKSLLEKKSLIYERMSQKYTVRVNGSNSRRIRSAFSAVRAAISVTSQTRALAVWWLIEVYCRKRASLSDKGEFCEKTLTCFTHTWCKHAFRFPICLSSPGTFQMRGIHIKTTSACHEAQKLNDKSIYKNLPFLL